MRIQYLLFVIPFFQILLAQNTLKNNLNNLQKQAGTKANSLQDKIKSQVVKSTTQDGIPLIGDLSDTDEIALGREIAGRVLSVYPSMQNDTIQRYLNLVGIYITKQTPRSNLQWTFALIESDEVNAFALPGGYILLTKGLYKILQNEAELAAVLAHEIAHVNLRHHVRLLQKELLISKGKDFLIGKTKHDAIKLLAGNGALLITKSLDRNAEFESDRYGLLYLVNSGYDPFAYREVLDRIGADIPSDKISTLYSTHPTNYDRLEKIDRLMNPKWDSLKCIIPNRWVSLP